jgi:hypothetical protein
MVDPNTVTRHEETEEKLGTEHEFLEGWVPPLATPDEIRTAFEKAFDYRGDISITLKSGDKVDGYIFDRRASSNNLDECVVRLMPKNQRAKISIRYSDIAALAFSGKDMAAGRSFAAWVKRYNEKKAAGEKNIRIDPEPLE